MLVAELLAEGGRLPLCVHVIDRLDARLLVDTDMTAPHPAVADMGPLNKQPMSAHQKGYPDLDENG